MRLPRRSGVEEACQDVLTDAGLAPDQQRQTGARTLSYRYEVEDYLDAGGGEVVMLVQVRAVTRRDGVAVEHAPAVVCRVRDDRIVRVDFYLDRRDAPGDVG